MFPHLPALEIATTPKPILFLGFDGDFDENIQNFPYNTIAYRTQRESDPVRAWQWLQNQTANLRTFEWPYAVICKINWLQANNFYLPTRMMDDPYLRMVPVVALSDNHTDVQNKVFLLQRGIDDCYSVPVEWMKLEQRLDFLNTYKPRMLDVHTEAADTWDNTYKIPFGKRFFDIVFASLAIVLTMPIWFLLALAIRMESKGPVIYRSKRVGAGYHVFDFLKFRSMYVDADQRLQEFQHLNQYKQEGDGPVFIKFSNDPRVTRIGRFIRKYSLDELPQLINVLRGDMSLVGNRPLPLYEAASLMREEWCARFLAPAGLTGLWQVTRRGKADMSVSERIALDITYAETHSFWTDMSIIVRTFGALVQKDPS